MNGPFWMVLINVIASIILLLGILTYRYIYPKKNIKLFVLLLLISIIPIISIFRPGVYESGDLSYHIMENMVFYQSLGEGNIVPVWAGEMNATYGFPAFMFFYPLPFYIMSAFVLFGFTFIGSAKLVLILSYILSGVFMYLWLRKLLSETSAFVGALFYLFAPYHFIDLHFRVDIGEVLAFAFIPLGLLAATNLSSTGKARWFVLEALTIGALFLSHPAISFLGVPTIFFYSIFLLKHPFKKLKYIYLQILAISTGILLAAFYIFPLLSHLRYTLQDSHFSKNLTFITLPELLFSPWKMGLLFQGPFGELAPILGYAQLLILIVCFSLLIKNIISKKYMQLLIPSLIIVVISIFMMFEFSKPIWYFVPLIKNFQFSYRLLGIIIFAVAVIAAIVAGSVKKKWFIILICLLAIFPTILNWGNRGTLPEITDKTLRAEIPYDQINGGGLSQAVTKWSDPVKMWAPQIPKKHIEIIKGDGEVKELTRKINLHKYQIDAKTQLDIKENTLYFPPWTLYIDGQVNKISILTETTPRGIISFSVPKGKHIVELVFQDTFSMYLGKFVSLATFILLLVILFFRYKFVVSLSIKKRRR